MYRPHSVGSKLCQVISIGWDARDHGMGAVLLPEGVNDNLYIRKAVSLQI